MSAAAGSTQMIHAKANEAKRRRRRPFDWRHNPGFGPFTLPPGQPADLRATAGSPDTRLANIGNKLFAALKLKMLLDYKARQMTFYGSCVR